MLEKKKHVLQDVEENECAECSWMDAGLKFSFNCVCTTWQKGCWIGKKMTRHRSCPTEEETIPELRGRTTIYEVYCVTQGVKRDEWKNAQRSFISWKETATAVAMKTNGKTNTANVMEAKRKRIKIKTFRWNGSYTFAPAIYYTAPIPPFESNRVSSEYDERNNGYN